MKMLDFSMPMLVLQERKPIEDLLKTKDGSAPPVTVTPETVREEGTAW